MQSFAQFTRAAALALGLAAVAPVALAADAPAADTGAAKPRPTSKLGECSHAAKEKGLKGEERKASIKECLAAAKASKTSAAKPAA
ncbi:PsiF family protein [Derxia lacustris]|uniref:PsiF family protein n=1 Tax=Derxia lacustris TaxID=764842 RepID=UPI000A16E12F|nr:PsiF family protein [Derxia lacustris]